MLLPLYYLNKEIGGIVSMDTYPMPGRNSNILHSAVSCLKNKNYMYINIWSKNYPKTPVD